MNILMLMQREIRREREGRGEPERGLGGLLTGGGDGSKTGLVKKKENTTIGISTSLIPDTMDKEGNDDKALDC